jgi:hypothetical protein
MFTWHGAELSTETTLRLHFYPFVFTVDSLTVSSFIIYFLFQTTHINLISYEKFTQSGISTHV